MYSSLENSLRSSNLCSCNYAVRSLDKAFDNPYIVSSSSDSCLRLRLSPHRRPVYTLFVSSFRSDVAHVNFAHIPLSSVSHHLLAFLKELCSILQTSLLDVMRFPQRIFMFSNELGVATDS